MSEYQYYEFQAVDRPLTKAEMAELRALSSRAQITPTRFVNVYNYGDFRGDPLAVMQQMFDVLVYVANWGTRHLMLRLPRPQLEPDAVAPFLVEHSVSLHITDQFTILEILTDPEEPEVVIDAEQWLPALLPLRADLADGDLRALYLAWLHFVQVDLIIDEQAKTGDTADEDEAEDGEERDDDGDWEAVVLDRTVEPPPPPGLGSFTAALDALVEFLDIDRDLIAVAAERSGPVQEFRPTADEWRDWIGALPEAEKDALLLEIAAGEPALARAMLQHRFRLARRRQEAERKAREREHRQREAAAARATHLAGLAGREHELWGQVEALLAVTQPKGYDQAVQLLLDLRDLARSQAGR